MKKKKLKLPAKNVPTIYFYPVVFFSTADFSTPDGFLNVFFSFFSLFEVLLTFHNSPIFTIFVKIDAVKISN